MKRLRYLYIMTAVIAAAVLGAGGCGTDRSNVKKERVTLSFMMPQSHYRDFFQNEIRRFEKENPDYHIDVLRIPDNQWIDVTKAKAATGELTDLVRIDRGLMEEIGAKRFVEMTEKEKWYDRVLPEQLDNKKIDGKLYGLPIGGTSSVGLVYNRDIFRKLNLKVPSNLDEFRMACRQIKDGGYTPFYVSDKDSWTTAFGFSTTVSQTMTDDTYQKLVKGQMKWNNEEYRSVLEEFAAVRKEGFTNPDYTQATYNGAVDALAASKTAMYLSGQFCIHDAQTLNPKVNLAMTPAPYNGDVLTIKAGMGLFAVSAESSHIKEAKKFLDWFSKPDNMNEFNIGWNHTPVFKDQNMEMSDWQQNLYDNYIVPKKTALEINERLNGIDMTGFWADQQKLYTGQMSAREVLDRWDQSFESQLSLHEQH